MPQLIELIEHHIEGLDDVAAHAVVARSLLARGEFDKVTIVLDGLEAASIEADRRAAAVADFAEQRGHSDVDTLPELLDLRDGPRTRRALSARKERLRTVQQAGLAVRVLAADTIRHLATVGGAAPEAPTRSAGHQFLVSEV
ncbi:MAG: hypothetical protein AAF480_02400 [Actinomycetota bacterium]